MTDLLDQAKRTPGKYTQPHYVTKLFGLLGRAEVAKLTGYSEGHITKVVAGSDPCTIALEKACKLEYAERTDGGKRTYILTADGETAERIFNILSSTNLTYETKRVA